MTRDPQDRYADILAAIDRCRRYQERLADADPLTAGMAYDAILRNLAVVGEAVRALPAEMKMRSPATPWPSIAGLRNIVVHEYFRVDHDLITGIVRDELLPLAEVIRRPAAEQPPD